MGVHRTIETNYWDEPAGFEAATLMNDDNVLELQEYGFEIGSHSMSHSDLTRLSRIQAQDEIYRSKDDLENLIGCPVITFAYPFGASNAGIEEMVREAGYCFGCGVYSGPPKFVQKGRNKPIIPLQEENAMNERKREIWTVHEPFCEVTETASLTEDEISSSVVRDTAALLTLSSEWDELASKLSGTIFQTIDWQYTWWKHFAMEAGQELYVALFRNEDKLVGIAPFLIQTYRPFHFGFFRRLMLLGSGLNTVYSPLLPLEREGPSDYLDVIVESGFEDKVALSLHSLLVQDSRLWDEIELQNIPESGFLFSYLVPLFEKRGVPVTRKIEDTCPVIPLPATLDGFLGSVSGTERWSLRHALRGVLQNPCCDVEDNTHRGDIDAAFQTLMQLHQKRWNEIGYPGMFSDSRFGPFISEVSKMLMQKGRLWFKSLRCNGKVAASNLCFTFSGRLYTYASGFDRERLLAAGVRGAGKALTLLQIIDAIDRGYSTVDMGHGTEPYKFSLTSSAGHNWRIVVSKGTGDSRLPRVVLFQMYSAYREFASRITCEIYILKLIAGEKGAAHALTGYISHL